MTSSLVELAVGVILELGPGPGISGSLSMFRVDSVIMLALEIFFLVVDIPFFPRVLLTDAFCGLYFWERTFISSSIMMKSVAL